MPQYELMYILSSAVADSDEPALTDELLNFITESGGQIAQVEKLGRKKLAYPIKRTRNGFYVLVNFLLDPQKISEVDHKVRVTPGLIRHLILNKEESLLRQAKDHEAQKLIRRTRPDTAGEEKRGPSKPRPDIQIDLDRQIEKALEEDLTK